jgi:hypothetical protein
MLLAHLHLLGKNNEFTGSHNFDSISSKKALLNANQNVQQIKPGTLY